MKNKKMLNNQKKPQTKLPQEFYDSISGVAYSCLCLRIIDDIITPFSKIDLLLAEHNLVIDDIPFYKEKVVQILDFIEKYGSHLDGTKCWEQISREADRLAHDVEFLEKMNMIKTELELELIASINRTINKNSFTL